jgi:peptidyl-prolyl cis-trans isomerase D
MLSLMRKHAGSWMIKVVLGAIVVTFVFWGGYQFTSQRLSRIANVNGAWITIDEFEATYKQLLNQVRQAYGNNLNEEILQTLGLRKQALDQLIDQVLMLQEAEGINLKVTDEELAQAVRGMSVFQTAGIFDPGRYRNVLAQVNLTPEAFQASQRDALLIQKLRVFITGSVKVSDQEMLEWYNWNNAEVSIDYALVEAMQFTDIEPTEELLTAYYEQNRDSYNTDPMVKVRYLAFKPEAYTSGVNISEDEIKDYYETNLEQFKNPKTVEARHILIEVAQKASDEKIAEAKTRIENVLKLAKDGQDFAELAKQYSEGPSKDQGGYLGKFQKDAMVKPFADKAFSMKAGEISDPVRTSYGWHIIKVESINPAGTTAFDDAKVQIQKKLLDDKTKRLAQEAADAAFDAAFEGDDLDTIATQNDLSVLETERFSQKGPAKGIKNPGQFAQVAFNLAENEVSDLQDFGDGYYLMEVVEKIPSKILEFETVSGKVRKDWVKEEQKEMARASANDLLNDLREGLTFDEAAKKYSVELKHTDFFKRSVSIPDIGYEPEISQVAFELSDDNKFPAEAVESQKGYYVLSFRGRKTPPADQFESQKAEIKQRLLQQKRIRTFSAWLEDTKSKAEISIVDEFQEG